jgi:uncharacterized C2H2 Zn-finger protein
MSSGYVYCFSNESMPGILKIGMTTRTPTKRLNDANASSTWKPPTDYKIEFAKYVSEPLKTEKQIHTELSLFVDRINPNREFFKISIEEARKYFDKIEGPYWEAEKDEVKDKIPIRKVKEEAIVITTTNDVTSHNKECSRCGNVFLSKTHLVRHLQKLKPCKAVLEDIDIDEYIDDLTSHKPNKNQCKTCDKSFKHRSSLSRHKKTCTQQISSSDKINELKNDLYDELRNDFQQKIDSLRTQLSEIKQKAI